MPLGLIMSPVGIKENMTNKAAQTIWGFPLADLVDTGFSDDQLDELVQKPVRSRREAPWLFWTTELYSIGKCLREWLSWPTWLPIPLYSDHGVGTRGALFPHEQNNPARYHLVWDSDRFNYGGLFTSKRLLKIPYPWIPYRHKMGYQPRPDRHGTLVFFPHSTQAVAPEPGYYEAFLQELNDLPDAYHPVVICLHIHDVDKGLHQQLRPHGFPIVTAGNSHNPLFVDRFYSLISHFEYATSPLAGSDLYHCYEFGIRYFIYGTTPVYINISDSNLPPGRMERLDIVAQKRHDLKVRLFSDVAAEPSAEKTEFVMATLGVDEPVNKGRIRRIMIFELIRLLPYYLWKSRAKPILGRLSRMFNQDTETGDS